MAVRADTGGRYADVANRLVGTVGTDAERLKAVADALRKQFPPVVKPFLAEHCLAVTDLMKIALPDDFATFTSGTDAPHANPETLAYVINYCAKHLQAWGPERIYLMGSRASGIRTNGDPVSQRSDHDFLVVIGDDAPDEMRTSGTAWSQFYRELDAARRRDGLNEIDLFVKKKADFETESEAPGSVAFKASRGVLVARRPQ